MVLYFGGLFDPINVLKMPYFKRQYTIDFCVKKNTYKTKVNGLITVCRNTTAGIAIVPC